MGLHSSNGFSRKGCGHTTVVWEPAAPAFMNTRAQATALLLTLLPVALLQTGTASHGGPLPCHCMEASKACMEFKPELEVQHFIHVSVSSHSNNLSVVVAQEAEEAAEPEGGSLQDPAVQVNPCLAPVHCSCVAPGYHWLPQQ